MQRRLDCVLQQNALPIQSLGDDLFQTILSYLDAKDLALVDACSTETHNLSPLAWKRLSRSMPVASSSQLDLQKGLTSKQRPIIHFRAARFAKRMELQNIHRSDRGNADFFFGNQCVCPDCGLLPTIEMKTFQEPESFLYFVRLSRSINSSQVVVWQGFVPRMQRRRGECGESAVLVCDLKAVSNEISWSSKVKQIPVDNPLFMKWVRTALGGLSVTVVAFDRENFQSSPRLVVSSSGLHSVSRLPLHERIFYNIQSRHCHNESTGNDSWVSPRLIARENPTVEKSGELLGLRLEMKGFM
jgi:hypothetical protein